MCGGVESQLGNVECLCFCVPTPEFQSEKYHEGYSGEDTATRVCPEVKFLEECSPRQDRTPQGCSADLQDICSRQGNIAAIPYPGPAPSVELRGGQIYSGCQCVKRDGLQHDCPRTGCQGRASCLAYPAPLCVPSGNAPPPPPPPPSGPPMKRNREVWPSGARHQAGGTTKTKQDNDHNDRYVRLGRCGYRENPPVKRHPRLPCEEHRKVRE